MDRPIRALTAALISATALAALSACGCTQAAGSSPSPQLTTHTAAPVIEGDTDAPDLSTRDLTKVSIDLTWDATAETDKDAMCDGISLFGTDWAAGQLRQGGGDDSLDWDYAAQLIEGKCEAR